MALATRSLRALIFDVTLVVAIIATALLAVTIGARPSAAAAACSFDGGPEHLTITLDGSPHTISRTSAGAIQLDGADCDGGTIFNTGEIHVIGTAGRDQLTIDGEGGGFGPGSYFRFNGITFVLGLQDDDVVTFSADDAATTILGRNAWVISWCAADWGFMCIAAGNVQFSGFTPPNLAVATGDADDTVVLNYEGEWLTPVELSTGGGNDTIVTGVGDDTIDPGLGDDAVDARTGNDLVSYALRTDPVTVDTTGGGASGETDTFTGVERLAGGSGDDDLSGDGNDNVLSGGAGADTLTGGGGDDVLAPGTGDDVAVCGDGDDDVVDYSDLVEDLTIDLGAGTSDNGTGDEDTLTDCRRVIGSGGNDTIDGSAEADVIDGSAGDDTIEGKGGPDSITGGADDDLILADADPADADSYAGGDGLGDVLDYSARTTSVTIAPDVPEGSGADAEADSVAGDFEQYRTGSGADLLLGTSGDEVFEPGGGADRIRPGAGDDTVVGDGSDAVTYSERTDDVVVDLFAGVGGEDGENDVLTNIRDAVGGAGDDRIIGSNGPNDLAGGSGDDLIDARRGDDQLDGGSGNDVVLGGDGDDELSGGAGNDVVRGGKGSDVVDGDGGDDLLMGDAGIDSVNGGPGRNRFFEGAEPNGADTLNALSRGDVIDYSQRVGDVVFDAGDPSSGEASEGDVHVLADDVTLVGGEGDDHFVDHGEATQHFVGGAGTDRVDYSANATPIAITVLPTTGSVSNGDTFAPDVESFSGGDGDDLFIDPTFSPQNRFSGNGGNDTISYAGRTAAVRLGIGTSSNGDVLRSENDVIDMSIENLVGGSGNDVITGNALVNTLRGNGGNDVITGKAGNDVIDGGSGNDRINEGSLATGGDSINGGKGIDVVDYAARRVALTVTLDGAANDGASGESDNVRKDVENVLTGRGADRITGSDAANVLSSGSGNDIVRGGKGADQLVCGSGRDTAYTDPADTTSKCERRIRSGPGRR